MDTKIDPASLVKTQFMDAFEDFYYQLPLESSLNIVQSQRVSIVTLSLDLNVRYIQPDV
jgi:hypothetical protein